jgi:hypothetical protein
LIGFTLYSRLEHASFTACSLTVRVAGGCPLGVVSCPFCGTLLAAINDQGFSTFGYAHNIVITVQDKFAHTVRELMQEALNVVVKWTAKGVLSISPQRQP